MPNAKIGVGKAIQAGWIEIDKSTGSEPRVLRKVSAKLYLILHRYCVMREARFYCCFM